MKKCVAALLAFGLALVGSLEIGAQGKVKVVTDPNKAGPDYAIQGEYVGEVTGQDKLGAEVVARGDGKFLVNILPDGLRGEGGDYAKRVEASATAEGGAAKVTSKDGKWTGLIATGTLTGKTADGTAFSLKRVVRRSKTLGMAPPKGAVVLFDGKSAAEWNNGKIVDDSLLGSDIDTKKKFKDHKLHLEFRLSFMPYATGQGRSNSGVYVQHRYEVQVLDSFGLKGENNECGGVYQQAKPLVNMCYPPLQWQTYDIEFKAARFDKDGTKKVSDAIVTVRHNGVLIHNKLALKGPTAGGHKESPEAEPLHLQGHGGQVAYRNIWAVEYGTPAKTTTDQGEKKEKSKTSEKSKTEK